MTFENGLTPNDLKIEPSRGIELARTLASCVRFETGQNYLTPEQFKNVVLGMNRTTTTAKNRQ